MPELPLQRIPAQSDGAVGVYGSLWMPVNHHLSDTEVRFQQSVIMNVIVLCPACGHQNAGDASHCIRCRTPLEKGRRVTHGEARDLDLKRRGAARRRRVVRWVLVVLFLLGVGGWTGYSALCGGRQGPPASDISANPTPGDWPMFQRSPAHSAFVSDAVPVPEGQVR